MQEIQPFGKNIWIVDGPNVRDMGITFTTRMTIVKLSDGSLWINSPVAVEYDTLSQIMELGTVKYLVAATPRHVWRLESWHKLIPGAQLWVPKSSPFTLKNREKLSFVGTLGDTTTPGWEKDIDQLAFKGNPLIEEVIFFHKDSRTIILDDLIQNHKRLEGKPFQNAFIKLMGAAYPNGGVGLDLRLTFIHRKLARRSLVELLSWDFDKMIISHGACIEQDAKRFVERAFQWLGLG